MRYSILEKVIGHDYLTALEAKRFIYDIHEDNISAEEISAILVGILMRGTQIDEVQGFREALLELCERPSLDPIDAVDLCGTGGDGQNTFNISTVSSLFVAALGYKVIKHGNLGVSSICGSSHVMAELGFEFSKDNKVLEEDLKRRNFVFLHAPLFHPVLKKVAPIRQKLGVRTLFNILGPLINPVQTEYQMTGTFNLETAHIYRNILMPHRRAFSVVYGLDGFDEITLTESTKILTKSSEHTLNASQYKLSRIAKEKLHGGTSVKESAKIARQILSGMGSEEQHQVIAVNICETISMIDGVDMKESFPEILKYTKSGKVKQHFQIN